MARETEALAVLRTGGSFEDAARISGMSVDEARALWVAQPIRQVVDGPRGPEFAEAD